MKIYKNLYERLASFPNLYRSYMKVRRGKAARPYIQKFDCNLEENLYKLKDELLSFKYYPRRMKKREIDDKSKKKEIYIPHLKDRIVLQALKQLLYPIFNKSFIHDSYAFRIGKGTHSAIKRFDSFKRKVAPRTNPNKGHILKMDIEKYYPNINHKILIDIINERIKDKRIIHLLKLFLKNSPNKTRFYQTHKGIPIGSPLSQLLANIYLNKLDYFVKHTLRESHYLRFGDDCVILSKNNLKEKEQKIRSFLRDNLTLSLHPQKTLHRTPQEGVNLLGYKIFYFHKRIKNKNLEKFVEKLKSLQEEYKQNLITPQKLTQKIHGWIEYARYADSYNLRKSLFTEYTFKK